MIREHNRIVLTEPVTAESLEVGDVWPVVHVYPDGKAFEVEFTTLDGQTAAVATVESAAIRSVTGHEITHARAHARELSGQDDAASFVFGGLAARLRRRNSSLIHRKPTSTNGIAKTTISIGAGRRS